MSEWKLRRWKTIRIEGFQLHRFINACTARRIGFRNLQMKDDCTAEAQVDSRYLKELRRLSSNRYRITVIGESGLAGRICIMLSRTATCVGLLVFFGILYYQSCFISQVKISGYEHLTELEIRQTLKELGFYPGAFKSFDLVELKTRLYHELDNVTWVGISYEGTVAEVTVLEGAQTPPVEDVSYPVHVVADRSGYLEKLTVKEGVAQKKTGDYVEEGDILISGIVPITDKSYTRSEKELERYVHAQGEVSLRVLYKVKYYQPKYSTILNDTGRWAPGIRICVGSRGWDSDRFIRPWKTSRRSTILSVNRLRPIPFSLTLYQSKETTVSEGRRLSEEIKKRAQQQARAAVKEIFPKDARLLKKDLSFSEKENIIEVNMLLHSLEAAGKDQPFLAPKEPPKKEAPEISTS